jgi:molecular chaperone GrpE
MDPNQDTDNSEYFFELSDETGDETVSVDDFIKELEAKEKDLHITADTTFIEIASEFEDGGLPDFLQEGFAEKGPKPVAAAAAKPTPAVANEPAVGNLEREISQLKDKISSMQTERTELFEKSQRRSKDFEAFKARTERERGDTFQKQLSNLATQMLPALDNLDRALKFASEMPEEKRNEFAQFFDGIVLVNQQINEVLMGMGIMPILTVGEPFDPHFHEAVAIEETTDLPPNTVCDELLRGFRIGNTVIRHSMVKVSKALSQPAPIVFEEDDEFDDNFVSEEPNIREYADAGDLPDVDNPVKASDDE